MRRLIQNLIENPLAELLVKKREIKEVVVEKGPAGLELKAS